MNDPTTPTQARRRGGGWTWAAIVGLGALIFLVHNRALHYGLFMDDWAHFNQLRESDWSLKGLTAACRLELVGSTIEMWWLPQVTLRFFRPVAFGLMKLTYTLVDWDPAAMHAASLLWHFAVSVLLLFLLRRLGASLWLAWAVAGLFALHPGNVATVHWIACQTELMVTTFLLGATLCWGRFRGWPGFGRGEDRATPGGWPWAAATMVLFVLALGCRENAAVLPLVLVAMEPFVGRQGRRRAIVAYGVMLVALVAYLGVRSYSLGGVALPPKPYVIPPGDPDFPRFIFDKLCYYLLGEFLLVPCIPIGGIPYLRAHPLAFYGATLVVVALLVFVCVRFRRQGVALLGPMWLVTFMLPLLPTFEAPHHLYLPGIGWAITTMLLIRALASVPSHATRTARLVRRGGLALVATTLVAGFGVASYYFGLAFETGQAVERCFMDEVAAADDLHDGDTLYIANMPLLGHYVRQGVEERTGLRNLRVVALTWSPRILGNIMPTELHWIDDRTIEIHIVDDHFFTGPLGLLVRGATGADIPDAVDRMDDLGFRMQVLARDAEGVTAFRYTFREPLGTAGIHLFWGSRALWAYEVYPPGSDDRGHP